MDEYDDITIAFGNMVLFHQPERWERLRRNWRYWRTGIGGRMRCKCGYVTGPGERFEYHQARATLKALRGIGYTITPPTPQWSTLQLRLT